MDENQSVQIKVIEKVNTQHKEEVQVIKVKNHVKGIYIYIYTLGTFRVCRITQSRTHRYLTVARFICYKKLLPERVSDQRWQKGDQQMCHAYQTAFWLRILIR
jgi:hypothetical protein